jgi:hypothetical protein
MRPNAVDRNFTGIDSYISHDILSPEKNIHLCHLITCVNTDLSISNIWAYIHVYVYIHNLILLMLILGITIGLDRVPSPIHLLCLSVSPFPYTSARNHFHIAYDFNILQRKHVLV